MTAPSPPVFLVGCGRSGTTVVYNTLAAHPGTAWFSRWSDSTLRYQASAAAPLYRRLFPRASARSRRFLPYPSEGYRVWDSVLGLDPQRALAPLTASDVTVPIARQVERQVAGHLRFGRGSVFVNKNTRNTRRIPFLAALYPLATFVHVTRHPLDVVASLLAVAWWPDLPLWTRHGESPRALGADPVQQSKLAAELWVQETTLAGEAQAMGPDSYIAVRYEDFVAEPLTRVQELGRRVGLANDDTVATFASLVRTASVGGWSRRLSASQIDAAGEIVEARAGALGYSLDAPVEG